jgi:Cytidylate kinase
MPIIILSSNSKHVDQEIAAALLKTDAYSEISPDVLPDIEAACALETGKLKKILDNPPGRFPGRASRPWQYQMACIEAGVIERLMPDQIICWGLGAHFYVQEVSHALKIRVIHNNEDCIQNIADREGISIPRADKWLQSEAAQRKKWGLAAYHLDESDPLQYDLVINLNHIDMNEATEAIRNAASYRKFQPVTYSIKRLTDLALAARVRSTLLQAMQHIEVQAKDGTVLVYTRALRSKKIDTIHRIKALAGNIEGVECVEVHVRQTLF